MPCNPFPLTYSAATFLKLSRNRSMVMVSKHGSSFQNLSISSAVLATGSAKPFSNSSQSFAPCFFLLQFTMIFVRCFDLLAKYFYEKWLSPSHHYFHPCFWLCFRLPAFLFWNEWKSSPLCFRLCFRLWFDMLSSVRVNENPFLLLWKAWKSSPKEILILFPWKFTIWSD